jgi:tRNA 2-selenouridine synthase
VSLDRISAEEALATLGRYSDVIDARSEASTPRTTCPAR